MMYHGTLTRIYGLDIAIEAFASAHGNAGRGAVDSGFRPGGRATCRPGPPPRP